MGNIVLTDAQIQKLLVLWLLLSTKPKDMSDPQNPTTMTPNAILSKWDADIGPHVADLQGIKNAFSDFATYDAGHIGDMGVYFQNFAAAQPPNWSGPGSCAASYQAILNLFPQD